MSIYLPIAEMPVNALVILFMGALVGFLSGMFGVGGGFLMTPALFFLGIPPAVAVSTEMSHIAASSISGLRVHWQNRAVDVRMGLVLLIGGFAGSTFGVGLFRSLAGSGQIDVVVKLLYVIFLGAIGALMVGESLSAIRRKAQGQAAPSRIRRAAWVRALPGKMRFPQSDMEISVILPIAIGFCVGILSALMGVGGGFIMVPAMIYLLGMPVRVVIGTSLFQVLFVSSFGVLMQSWQTQTVDVVLAVLLVIGGVVGAPFGARIGQQLAIEHVRVLMGLLVLSMGVVLAIDIVIRPSELFALARVGP